MICRYVKKNVSVVARLCSDDQSIFDTSILGGENDYIIYIYICIYIYVYIYVYIYIYIIYSL